MLAKNIHSSKDKIYTCTYIKMLTILDVHSHFIDIKHFSFCALFIEKLFINKSSKLKWNTYSRIKAHLAQITYKYRWNIRLVRTSKRMKKTSLPYKSSRPYPKLFTGLEPSLKFLIEEAGDPVYLSAWSEDGCRFHVKECDLCFMELWKKTRLKLKWF